MEGVGGVWQGMMMSNMDRTSEKMSERRFTYETNFLINTHWIFWVSTIPYFLREVKCKLITPAPQFNASIRVNNDLGIRSVTLFPMENSPILQ